MRSRPSELLADLPVDDALTAMDEHRPDQLWLVAHPAVSGEVPWQAPPDRAQM
jgi:hypothetical protein